MSPSLKRVDRKGKGKATDSSLHLVKKARVYDLRRMKGVGVKIHDPEEGMGTRVCDLESKSATVKEEPVDEDLLDLMESPWVRFTNEVLFDQLKKIPIHELERFSDLEKSPDTYEVLNFFPLIFAF